MHNAKGLEFPFVFIAGMEEGLFPHSRSIGTSEAALEEERRLCYVGMTRAEKRLYLSWARYRRRFGGGEPERTIPSRFLDEIPAELMVNLGEDERVPQVDLYAERHDVRQAARRNTFTGKTYNSLENISQFFGERGMPFPVPARPAPAPHSGAPQMVIPKPPAPGQAAAHRAPPAPKKLRAGMMIEHPVYGEGHRGAARRRGRRC